MGRKIRLNDKVAEFIGEMLEIPSAPVTGGFSVRVTDGREVYITGCRAILSYDDGIIVVKTGEGTLTVNGEGLDIGGYTDSEITVRGTIHSVIMGDKE